MNELTPRAAPEALIAKHGPVLALYEGRPMESVTERTQLIPMADLPSVIAALQAPLSPATPRQVDEIIATIAAAWAHAYQKLEPSVAALHVHQLREDMGGFPADVLNQVVRELRRNLKFAPSIAEIYGPASDLLAERWARLRIAEAHLAEHERREAAERAEAERREARRREVETRISILATHLGAPFDQTTPDDFEAAELAALRCGFLMAARWDDGVRGREPWLRRAFPVAVLAGRAFNLRPARKISDWDLSQIIGIASRDIGRAKQIVAAIEAGDPAERWLDRSEESIWEPPARVLAEIVAEAQARETEATP